MKNSILTLIFICCFAATQAQNGNRIYRTEFAPYATRHEAEARKRTNDEFYRPFTPKVFATEGGVAFSGQEIDVPYPWTDGNVYLHLENVGSSYTLTVNNVVIAQVEDYVTPADFFISPNIKQGQNAIILELRKGEASQIEELQFDSTRVPFENSYLFCQNKRSILDYTIELVPDSTRKFGVLNLDIIAQNSYNYQEPISVGYDIYSPEGKLLDFNIVERTLQGRSVDTVRLKPFIYHTNTNQWGEGVAPLYKVMLFLKRDGAYKEYIPLTVGFGKSELKGDKLIRFDEEITLTKQKYNAISDRKTALADLKKIKASGKNTICPDYPQPYWFYEICDQLGLYVIDCANINAPTKSDDRRVGGTPSNVVRLKNEYLERIKAMYYRSRNHSCVVAFSIGGESGNGYNMYKGYQWLKSIEKSRPIIYIGADGEWNSDKVE